MVVRRRSMKENTLRIEIDRISSIRYREERGRARNTKAAEIFGSSEIAKAIIGKKGHFVNP